jgi:hypothetical protein
VYNTHLSVGEQIEESFLHYRRPHHPDITGRRNLFPYHGLLSDVEEENPWGGAVHPDDTTVLLRRVEPQPLEGFDELQLEDGDHGAT